jgi:hypothetical protein
MFLGLVTPVWLKINYFLFPLKQTYYFASTDKRKKHFPPICYILLGGKPFPEAPAVFSLGHFGQDWGRGRLHVPLTEEPKEGDFRHFSPLPWQVAL